MTAVVTGARGFIGQNLMIRLKERGVGAVAINSAMSAGEVEEALSRATIVFHLAGVNRPENPAHFLTGNVGFTRLVLSTLSRIGNRAPLVYASSVQAALENDYGRSKRAAEDLILAHAASNESGARIFRLANVFGKWARPNYNSAVATFCHNIARDQDITVHDPSAPISLVYIDDVCDAFVELLDEPMAGAAFTQAEPVHHTTVGEIADAIRGFRRSRSTLMTSRVGGGLARALYSTYVSYLPPEAFTYEVPRYSDPRGSFAEVLKTPDCGQFSYFTADPGVTRGDHYHHTKTEKFLVLSGSASFGFRNLVTGECYQVVTNGDEGRVVETIPGWVHNITNIGETQMVVMLWANEVFDRERPDTVAQKV